MFGYLKVPLAITMTNKEEKSLYLLSFYSIFQLIILWTDPNSTIKRFLLELWVPLFLLLERITLIEKKLKK